jgi:hypothetical protein
MEVGVKLNELVSNVDSLVYGNFMEAHAVIKVYQELPDRAKVMEVVEEALV